MFDLGKLDQWDEALKRLETAPKRMLEDLYREVMEVQAERADRPRTRKQESRAA
jgi:hypothetical protein